MLEDGTHTLKVADFGFSDTKDSPENALAGVKITTLESAGSLKLNGVDVDLNKFISVADIKAGKLKFKPAMDANGDGYANFEFAVMDNGGDGLGGKDTDATPNKITFNVTAVNDAPEGHDKTVTMIEDGTRVSHSSRLWVQRHQGRLREYTSWSQDHHVGECWGVNVAE